MSTIFLAAVLGAGLAHAVPTHPRPRAPRPMRLTATAYCGHGKTAAGVRTSRGMVAADPRLLPVGSVIRLQMPARQYNGTYIVADTGSAVKGHRVDIFTPSCTGAKRFGRRPVVAWLIRRGTLPAAAVGRRISRSRQRGR